MLELLPVSVSRFAHWAMVKVRVTQLTPNFRMKSIILDYQEMDAFYKVGVVA